jgi:hypothetical protein
MQIIVGALAIGIINFLGVIFALDLDLSAQGVPASPPWLSYAAVGGSVVAVILSLIVPVFFSKQAEQSLATPNAAELDSTAVRKAAQIYQAQLMVRCALVEGAAFFCLVAYMLERQTASVITAVVLLVVILLHIPSSSRIEAWIEQRLFEANQLRQLRS